MLEIIMLLLILASIAGGYINGTMSEVSAAAIGSCSKAVELIIFLAGPMALWTGMMRIAEKCGITGFVCKLVSPVIGLLFKGIDSESRAGKAIGMNLTANLLGLGNAATPTGIEAVKELDRSPAYRRRNIAMLVVLNTASIQLLPTTIASIRLAHGSAEPFAIMLPVLAVSFASAAAGCLAVWALYEKEREK